MNRIPLATGFLTMLASLAGLAGGPLDQWQWRNPLPSGNAVSAVSYADGRFVAVGGGGQIAVSTDGTNWTSRLLGPIFGSGTNYGLERLLGATAPGWPWGPPNAPAGRAALASRSPRLTWSTGFRIRCPRMFPPCVAWFTPKGCSSRWAPPSTLRRRSPRVPCSLPRTEFIGHAKIPGRAKPTCTGLFTATESLSWSKTAAAEARCSRRPMAPTGRHVAGGFFFGLAYSEWPLPGFQQPRHLRFNRRTGLDKPGFDARC